MLKFSFIDPLIAKIKSIIQVRRNQAYLAGGFVFIVVLMAVFLKLSKPEKTVVATPTLVELTATLKETRGSVSIKQPGQSDFSPANPGDILQLHGQIQTGSSSSARLDLTSGTIIRVPPSSMFTLEDNHETSNGLTTTLNLTLGQVFVILEGGSLNVKVPSGVASVRGSYMSALIYPASGKVFVQCLEGHCAAINGAGELDLTNGQKGIFIYEGDGMDQLPQLTNMNPNDYASWLAISPEAQDIIKGNGSNSNQGQQSGQCNSSHTQSCP